MKTLAYIDPGLGLLIWQTAVAAFVGLIFYLKKTRSWIFNLFRKVFRDKSKPGVPAAEAPQPGVETGR
jgi:hypothetical protein